MTIFNGPRFDVAALAALLLLASAPSLAQVVEGVDAGAARQRAKEQIKDGEAFTREIGKRSATLNEEAERVRAAALANKKRLGNVKLAPGPKGPVDFDALLAGAARVADGPQRERGPRFVAFASLSMPPAALRSLIRDVSKAGGSVVFRGFKDNSVKAHMAALSKILNKTDRFEGLGIDPRLFRAFAVTAVPAYVVTTADMTLCDGFRCVSQPPPFDKLAGSVTAEYALETFAQGRGPGAPAARVFLKRLQVRKG